jgi:hypothetical protein
VSSTLFELANSEIPIRVKDVVSWAIGHMQEELAEGLRVTGVPSEIGNRGFVRAVTHDRASTDFPTGKIPDKG